MEVASSYIPDDPHNPCLIKGVCDAYIAGHRPRCNSWANCRYQAEPTPEPDSKICPQCGHGWWHHDGPAVNWTRSCTYVSITDSLHKCSCVVDLHKYPQAMFGINEPSEPTVNHPQHYTQHLSGVECIQITEHYSFCVGNAIKYLWRHGLKQDVSKTEDLKKARWYIDREIARLEAQDA